MIIYPNYTFSVPDKRLYAHYKGITVTPRVVQASACLRTAKAPLHAAPLVTASYGAPLHVWCSHVLRRPFDGAKATVRAAPSVPNQPTTPPRPHWASETSRLDCLPPCAGAYPTRGASGPFTPSASRVTPPHLRRRKPAPFGIAEGGSCSCETTLTQLEQHQRYH
jgi:hypothetical protein